MKRILLACAVAGLAVPAFAQDVSKMACSDFMKADNTGRMALVAQLQSAASQQSTKANHTPDEIFSMLSTQCTAHPDMMMMDVYKAM